MRRVRALNSGFRTEESTGFIYRGYFFQRFVQRYPGAIRELAALLPLFREVFGDPVDISDDTVENECSTFDRNFLLSREELLIYFDQAQLQYSRDLFSGIYHIPEYLSLPNDHPNKCNEDWVKKFLGSCIVSAIAEMRANAGNCSLQRHLAKREHIARKARAITKEKAKKIAKENAIQTSEDALNHVAHQETAKVLKSAGYFEDTITTELLAQYWRFYERYHAWLERYCLQKDWLRRSFFIALRRNLLVLWPDMSFDVSLPGELVTEIHSEPGRFDFRPNQVTLPPPFEFTLTTLTTNEPGFVKSQHRWESMPYFVFWARDVYLEDSVADFQRYINQQAFSDRDEEIKAAVFPLLPRAQTPETAHDLEHDVINILQYIYEVVSPEASRAERREVAAAFREHLSQYVDSLLPKLGKRLKSNTGRPPSLARIEWILCWNVDGLTDKQICDKFSDDSGFSYEDMAAELRLPSSCTGEFLSALKIAHASTFYAAKKAMRKYDIPVRSGRQAMPVWRSRSILESDIAPTKN